MIHLQTRTQFDGCSNMSFVLLYISICFKCCVYVLFYFFNGFFFFFFLMIRRPPRSPLFPYTPPFRSKRLPTLAVPQVDSTLPRRSPPEIRRLVFVLLLRALALLSFERNGPPLHPRLRHRARRPFSIRSDYPTPELQSPCTHVCRVPPN